jgi:hypothetical protein
MKRVGVFVSLLIAWSLAFAVPVLAAAPSNDTFGGATVIGSLPFTDTLDTTEATTDATDQEANADCGAPATDASVWYTVTASSDDGLAVDVSQSDYSAGVIVVTGSPGSFTFVTCGPGAVEFPTVNGETYSIVAFDDQQDGAGNGGTLVINVDVVPPPPVVALTDDHRHGDLYRWRGLHRDRRLAATVRRALRHHRVRVHRLPVRRLDTRLER